MSETRGVIPELAPARTSHLPPCERERSRFAILARTLDGWPGEQPGQRGNRLRCSVGGGAAEVPVVDLERSG
jgi:hypothetical protein